MKKKHRSPDYLCIGTMKSGTTWLWKQFRAHPEVGVPKKKSKNRTVKEFHLFDRLTMSMNDYKESFGQLDQKKVGEFTPNYFSSPFAPKMIRHFFPDVKLFVLLRNPIDRAFSHYKDHLWLKKIASGKTFREAFEEYDGTCYSIKNKGMYADLLKVWHQEFNDNQLKVFFYDDLVNNPLNFLKSVFQWVGVDPLFVPPEYDKKVVKKYNKAFDSLVLSKEDRKVVSDFYEQQISKLSVMTGRNLVWK